jgi:hypothetical protein
MLDRLIFRFLQFLHALPSGSGTIEMTDNSKEGHLSADGERPAAAQIFRTVIRSARFTPEEWEAVEERAAAVGLSPSRFLRQVALGTPLGRRINQQAVVALNRLGVNLNNLVRLALRSGQPLLAAEATDLLKQLRERLQNFL